MARPKTTGAGKLAKVECHACGQGAYQTLANLRDFYRPECCGVPMTVAKPELYALSKEGRESAEALAVSRWEKTLTRELVAATIQLQCKCCGQPQSKEHSAELIHAWEVQNQSAYDGRELMITYDVGLHDLVSVDPCKCGGDRYTQMRKRGKSKKEEVSDAIPF